MKWDGRVVAGVSKVDTEFEQWANKVWNLGAGSDVSLRDFRKDVLRGRIKLENEGWERDTAVVEPSEPGFTEP